MDYQKKSQLLNSSTQLSELSRSMILVADEMENYHRVGDESPELQQLMQNINENAAVLQQYTEKIRMTLISIKTKEEKEMEAGL